jgi:formylglycine-generating enzyme required for sulfatase activity
MRKRAKQYEQKQAPQASRSPSGRTWTIGLGVAMRGGSYLCTDQYCSRYMVGTRGKGEVSTGTNHLEFRCVKDRAAASAP